MRLSNVMYFLPHLSLLYYSSLHGINSIFIFIEVASPPLTGADSSSGQLQVKLIEVLKNSSINSCDV